jgi:ATP-binding cassette subfamily B protein
MANVTYRDEVAELAEPALEALNAALEPAVAAGIEVSIGGDLAQYVHRPEASAAEVVAAAQVANAHDFVCKLPHGYDTLVGERGHTLSGGERQRISIARAVLSNPRILILDEATSAVDTETERKIQEAMDRLAQGRTVFAIAHRLSTLRRASRLLVVEGGTLREVGTHAELMKNEGGTYRRLYELQQQLNDG